tara:strand:+ start:26576 stop:27796 length:1221 start_codon:yes stop_codon:yes gene_type:complete
MNGITADMARQELARRELARRQGMSGGQQMGMQQPMEQPQQQMQQGGGIGSIPGDLGDALLNLFMAGGDKVMQLPDEVSEGLQPFGEHPLKATGRAGTGILASMLEGGKQLYNLPLNINTYLGGKGIPGFKQTAPYAEKLKIGETGLQKMLMGEPQKGDQLWQDVGTAASLVAGPEMAGVRVPAVTAKGIVKQITADKAKYLGQAQKDFGDLFGSAAEQGFTHAPPLKSVTKHQAEIVKNSVPKYHKSLQKYLADPTIENAHWAQSELGALTRHLDSVSKKVGLTPSQVKTYKAAVEARKGVQDSMFSKNALGDHPFLGEKYNELRNKYREEVIPYTRLEELGEVEQKRMRPGKAVKSLMNDDEFMIQLSKRYPGLLAHSVGGKTLKTLGAGALGWDEIKHLLGLR